MAAALGRPRCRCGRSGTDRTDETNKALCGRACPSRPGQWQVRQGRAANCCASREGCQGLRKRHMYFLSTCNHIFQVVLITQKENKTHQKLHICCPQNTHFVPNSGFCRNRHFPTKTGQTVLDDFSSLEIFSFM